MSEIAERYRKVAADFTRRVDAVPDDAWDNPTPCDGWVARDVVGHLARATGLDETLDADEVHKMLMGIEPLGDTLEQSGHYGPRVAVPDDADEQTKLLAFTGRQP